MYDLQECVDVDGCEIFTYYDLTGLCLLYSECNVADCDAGQDCITGVPDGQVRRRRSISNIFEFILQFFNSFAGTPSRTDARTTGAAGKSREKTRGSTSISEGISKFHGISL